MEDKALRHGKKQANYLLPPDLFEAIAIQAAREGGRPAHVVEKACRRYLKEKARKAQMKGATCAAY